jgi:arginine/lysine/histidine transport system permease protein
MSFFESFYSAFYTAVIEKDRYLLYLEGIVKTIQISIFAILIGIAIGMVVAIAKVTSSHAKHLKWMNVICNCYITIIRATPVMLQLLIIYNLIFTSRNTNEIMVGAMAFGINSGAYVAEIIRAGIESIDKGQMEAGRSLGLNYLTVMRYAIIPQAVKNILPALGNEFIVLIKETSVAGMIAVTELTKAAQLIGNTTYDILPPLYIAAVCYLIMVLGLTKLLSTVERRLGQGDRR